MVQSRADGAKSRALVALGGNLDGADGSPPAVMLCRAVAALSNLAGGRLRAVSRFYRTPAFPAGSGPDYVNACAALDWPGTGDDLLAALHRIEAELGRDRSGAARWQSRVVDLDLLALGGLIRPDPATEAHWRGLPVAARGQIAPPVLILPHPRLSERGFVLVPLADIAPRWTHPATGLTVAAMLAALPVDEVAAIAPLWPEQALSSPA
ncbi:2-amino-4-hydroxy-6-hydroxymethyldihydropteridine diphosphokinase [Paracoccus sp. p4-l81]|uniref:2-amino-4-hydroxy-6- hydroxymethyldihydropteridine diphosphokinase n=1 Tax=unclassified Paracoccus (in: a-proteobacteria) TaxID=2688777 RepID=UPI0035BAC479